MRNVGSDLAARMSRKLLDGLVTGQGAEEVARGMVSTLGVPRGRAMMIARTEIIRAHAEGQLDAMKAMGVEEVGVQVEWIGQQISID